MDGHIFTGYALSFVSGCVFTLLLFMLKDTQSKSKEKVSK